MLEAIALNAMNYTVIGKTAAPPGFTLIELVITIAIAAVLATLAAPSFRDYMANQRVRNASFDLIASIAFARSEAITRNVPVTAEVDIVPVNAANWANGWSVSIGGGPPLRAQSAYSNLLITGNLAQLTYGKDGRLPPTTTFTATIAPSPSLSGVTCRVISIRLGGTANSALGACP